MASTLRPFFPTRPRLARAAESVLSPVDRLFNRVYGSAYNPLYQSGTLAVFCLLVLVVTGLYLLLFYRIGNPYESVAGIQAQWWLGRWVRAVHIYAGEVLFVAVVVHMLRMLLQGRTWGKRVLAWLSGVAMLGVILFSGWTGLLLVWDQQGWLVATEGARLLDILPVFSEPIARTFYRVDGVPGSFFFLNLILHMVFPFGVFALLLVHTMRVARARIMPPRPLAYGVVAGLLALALAWPPALQPRADPFRLIGELRIDGLYAFWLPLVRDVSPWWHLGAWALAFAVLFSVPLWWRPRLRVETGVPAPAVSNEDLCTGCTQCYQDCPYGAISMVAAPPTNTTTDIVARVNPAMCVSCGICAGSCAPMVIGPPGRAGRDHISQVQAFMGAAEPGARDVVVMGCTQGLGADLAGHLPEGVHAYGVHCVASMHTSAIEYLLRRGVGGVYVLGCPERDCVYREGVTWAHERLYNDREAELKERVDRTRVQLGTFARAERRDAVAALAAFREEIARRADETQDEGRVELDTECEQPEAV